MSNKLEILYPRKEAKITVCEDRAKSKILKKIALIENGKTMGRYNKLQNELFEIVRSAPKFTCGKCGEEERLKNLILLRFVSFSNTMDNDRYEDDNIICPKCGCFNYVKEVNEQAFKKIETIYE